VQPEDAAKGEVFYPLRVAACECCWLVQLDDNLDRSVHFHGDYVYFSSFSASWLEHARDYVEKMTRRFDLGPSSRVMELASNDGYLLQYFVSKGIACVGIEPAANTAAAAREKGVETRELFFGKETAATLAAEGWKVDLLLGNNVLAHVPEINDFVGGMPAVLKSDGVITLEFPHLLTLLEDCQFDTIYHEHYSYLSLLALEPVFHRAGLRIFDVEQIPTHGGSLRLYACHEAGAHTRTTNVADVLEQEAAAGLGSASAYAAFGERVRQVKKSLVSFLVDAKSQGKRVAAYGAAAKGNTLLNYCGANADLIEFVADKNPAKQDRLLPGSRIPVVGPSEVFQRQPDYLLILPWNIKEEVMRQMAGIRDWGGRFVTAIPSLDVY
jgi:SAM-dependent methyltransferase